MADDKDGTRGCLSAGELIQYRTQYNQYAIQAATNGEEPLSFDAWLNSMGRRRCGPMAG
jgi:hypothetical protein